VRPFVVAGLRDLQNARTIETNDTPSAPPVDRTVEETAAAQSTSTGSDPAPDNCENVEQVLTVRDGAAAAARPGPEWSSLRFVAQVRQTYLICEGRDGLYVIDQHAAAERVNFDRLRRQYQARTVASQALLFPMPLAVTPDEAELVEEKAAEFRALGLDLRARGPETVSIHAAPKLLSRASPEQLVRDLLAEVSRTGNRAFSDAVDLALATMACHGSIRAGDPVSSNEVAALLTALDQVDFAGHCPHGRPLVAFTAWGELERRVGRR
jgi:DNA mismatch repair protein MutL